MMSIVFPIRGSSGSRPNAWPPNLHQQQLPSQEVARPSLSTTATTKSKWAPPFKQKRHDAVNLHSSHLKKCFNQFLSIHYRLSSTISSDFASVIDTTWSTQLKGTFPHLIRSSEASEAEQSMLDRWDWFM